MVATNNRQNEQPQRTTCKPSARQYSKVPLVILTVCLLSLLHAQYTLTHLSPVDIELLATDAGAYGMSNPLW
jgi:hypothetical protein